MTTRWRLRVTLPKFRANVTYVAPHAPNAISWGKLTFDKRVELHRVRVLSCTNRYTSQYEQLLYRKAQRFQVELACQAHRLLYHSTLGLRVIKKIKGTGRNLVQSLLTISDVTVLYVPTSLDSGGGIRMSVCLALMPVCLTLMPVCLTLMSVCLTLTLVCLTRGGMKPCRVS